MKKIILAAVTVAALNTVHAESCTSNFTGFYAGAQIGLNFAKTKYDDVDIEILGANVGAAETKISKRKTAFLGGLFAGYGMGVGSCAYVGAELYLNFTSTKTSPTYSNVTRYDTDTVTHSTKSTYNLGFKPRIGYIINPQTMVFLGLGLEYSKYKSNISVNGTNAGVRFSLTGNGSKNIWSFGPSLGAEFFVAKNVFIRGEYSYLIGQKFKANYATSANGVSTSLATKTKTNQQRLVVGVGYKF